LHVPKAASTQCNKMLQYHIILCKIWGFHGGEYQEWCLLGCYTMWLL
jgi:hypothetical protein